MSNEGKWHDQDSKFKPIEFGLDCSTASEYGPAEAVGFCVQVQKIAVFMTRDAAVILRDNLTACIESPDGLR